MRNLIYGANIQVYIKYENSLEELSQILSKELEMPPMRIENSEYGHFDLVAYLEVFGFEMQLSKLEKNKHSKYQFLFEANTMGTLEEIAEGRMYDLSLWMAKMVTLNCEIETLVENEDTATGQRFHYDFSTFEVINSDVVL